MKNFEFKPFDKVLARDYKNEWATNFFSHYEGEKALTLGGCEWSEVIPFEGNEHLRGTTDPYIEPYVPEDGDFAVCSKGDERKSIFIFEKMLDNEVWTYAIYFFSDSKLSFLRMSRRFDSATDLMRPATEEEKNELLSNLHKIGKDWDAETKEVVDWKWMPKLKERFFQPYFDRNRGLFICGEANWLNTDPQEKLYKKGWAFKKDAEEECQLLCNKLNAAIKNVK